jgi:3-methyladenine DNA glycosylase AlkD
MTAESLERELQKYANAQDATFLQRFFKTDEGQYGEGDVFIGVRVPDTRHVCKLFQTLPLIEVQKLLESDIHECRLAAVILLTDKYKKGNEDVRRRIYNQYLQAVYDGHVNNWDIVDLSAKYIVGGYLQDKPRRLLITLASSSNVWQRRVAVLSTFAFIDQGEDMISLLLAEQLLHDPHDLIQKAVGWMLREVGKRCSEASLTNFLDRYAAEMPRTMLRYSIERLDLAQRKRYMQAKNNDTVAVHE